LNLAGINVQVEAIQKSLLLEQTSRSQAMFFRGSWIADYPDAENYLSVFYGKNPAPPNYTRYQNPVYDELYERAIAEKDDSLRYKLYQQMDQCHHETMHLLYRSGMIWRSTLCISMSPTFFQIV
jgi:peptide/nickel transport system substrate-binding protein